MLRRILDLVPPTPRGVAVGVVAALALGRWGYGDLDLVVFVFALSGLVLLGLACLVTVLAAVYLARREPTRDERRLDRLETGTPLATGFSLPALARVPLVKIDWRWTSPAGVETRTRLRRDAERKPRLVEEVVARRRGEIAEVEREIEVADAFGLTRVAWRHRETRPLLVLPHVGRLNALDRVRSLASAEGLPHPSGAPEGDRMEIRPYVPGDSPRHILWKVYARTRQLEVRVPERAVDRSRRTAAYLLAGPDDEAAAAVARTALEKGLLGPSWIFAADGSPEPVDELEPAIRAIARSGSFADAGAGTGLPAATADGLRAFLAHPEVRRETHCVVFAAARPGAWVDPVLAATRAFGGTFTFVLGLDGVSRRGPRPLWHRVLFAESDDEPTLSPEDLRRVTASFAAAHLPCLVVDRTTGRRHGRLDSPGTAVRRAG